MAQNLLDRRRVNTNAQLFKFTDNPTVSPTKVFLIQAENETHGRDQWHIEVHATGTDSILVSVAMENHTDGLEIERLISSL